MPSIEAEGPVPIFPDMSLPMRYVFEATERLPCIDGGVEDACVRLRMESEPDGTRLTAFVERFVARAGGDVSAASGALQQMSWVDTIDLVAAPSTLLPYQLDVTMEIGADVRGLPAGTSPFRRFRETRCSFAY